MIFAIFSKSCGDFMNTMMSAARNMEMFENTGLLGMAALGGMVLTNHCC